MNLLTSCIFFIVIFLNGSKIFAEEEATTIAVVSNDVENNSTVKSTESTNNNDNVTKATKNDTDITTAQAEIYIKNTSIELPDVNNTTQTSTTISDKHKSKKTTRSVDYITGRPLNDYFRRGNDAHDQELVDIMQSLRDDIGFDYRRGELTNITHITDEHRDMLADSVAPTRKPPGYFGRLTGSLVMPALKARYKINNGITKSQEGLKNFGHGTYEAASGAVTFLKDATRAIYNSG